MSDQTYRLYLRQGEFELDVEGDRDFVQSYVSQILLSDIPMAAEGAKKAARALPEKPKAQKQAKSAPAKPESKPAAKPPAEPPADIDQTALKAYMKGKKVNSDRERYLYYMGFLKSQGIVSVSDKIIHNCYVADGLKAPETGRQNFSIMRNSKLTEPTKERGFWRLTPEGEKQAAGGAKAAQPKKPAAGKKAEKKASAHKAKAKGKGKSKRKI